MEESVIYDIETTGLNPCRDRILAIGLSIIGKEYRVIYSENESKILQEFINELVDSDVLLVGWNSYSFDLPFIICRAALLEVDGFHGLVELDHLDAMKAAVEVSTCSREWLSQEEYAARLDVLVEDSWSGEDMPEAYSR